jgi:hypothetical protein
MRLSSISRFQTENRGPTAASWYTEAGTRHPGPGTWYPAPDTGFAGSSVPKSRVTVGDWGEGSRCPRPRAETATVDRL